MPNRETSPPFRSRRRPSEMWHHNHVQPARSVWNRQQRFKPNHSILTPASNLCYPLPLKKKKPQNKTGQFSRTDTLPNRFVFFGSAFSIGKKKSLKNSCSHWEPQIQSYASECHRIACQVRKVSSFPRPPYTIRCTWAFLTLSLRHQGSSTAGDETRGRVCQRTLFLAAPMLGL